MRLLNTDSVWFFCVESWKWNLWKT